MKFLTLNTHSLMEKEYEKKLNVLVDAIVKFRFDVIALQEIMQPINNCDNNLQHINVGKIPLKAGNHGANIVEALKRRGYKYNLMWLGFKKSYDKFDEGLAMITPYEIEEFKAVTLTPFDDYENWKTRKAIGAKIKGEWFYCVHFGWWDSFKYEFEQLCNAIETDSQAWILGDFNSPSNEHGKGYDLVRRSGFYDTYNLAVVKDSGITVKGNIDGWNENSTDKRIDYIFSNKKVKIDSSIVIFNGTNEDIISDHFGIILTTGENLK